MAVTARVQRTLSALGSDPPVQRTRRTSTASSFNRQLATVEMTPRGYGTLRDRALTILKLPLMHETRGVQLDADASMEAAKETSTMTDKHRLNEYAPSVHYR